MTFSCIEGDRPEASRIVCIARNISEDLRFESVQRMQTLVAQAAKMSALGEMAGGIAHEINNHLAVLLLRTTHTKTILEDSPIDKALVVRDLNKIEVAANRISKIVSGLKNLSRNADDDPFISVKIASIIEDTMSLCQERLKHAEIELKVDTIPDLSLECRPSQIAQVLLNLMNNAADAIAEHSAKWIEVQVREAGDRVHFLVTDSGNGISPEVARKLMQPFFTTKPLGKGTGLGLSISHQICEQHHGNLTYNSESKNTQFVIEIPKLKQAAAQA